MPVLTNYSIETWRQKRKKYTFISLLNENCFRSRGHYFEWSWTQYYITRSVDCTLKEVIDSFKLLTQWSGAKTKGSLVKTGAVGPVNKQLQTIWQQAQRQWLCHLLHNHYGKMNIVNRCHRTQLSFKLKERPVYTLRSCREIEFSSHTDRGSINK